MKKKISITAPVFNESGNIPVFYLEVIKAVLPLVEKYDFEIVFVNDGSKDASWQEIQKIAGTDSRVKGISFSRNFGHQAALEAGLQAATGDAVISMDSDLQHPPELIPVLVNKWEEGFDIVGTKRKKTEDESNFKRSSSYLFYALINKISDVQIEPGSADFRLLSRRVLTALNKLPEKDKFYRGLVNWIGFESTYIEYDAPKRMFGKSSYTFKKMLTLARVGLTSFSYFPMKVIVLIGSFLFVTGTVLLAIMIYFKYFVSATSFSGTAILASFIILNNGIVILLVGINSVYLMSMIKELKNRPTFIIKETTELE